MIKSLIALQSLSITIILLIFKVKNIIDWSWWWIISPIWIPILLTISILFLIFLASLWMLSRGYTEDDIKKKFRIKK